MKPAQSFWLAAILLSIAFSEIRQTVPREYWSLSAWAIIICAALFVVAGSPEDEK